MTKRTQEAGQMRACVEELTNRNWVWIDLPTDRDNLWEQVDDLLNENNAEEWRIADLDVIETYGIKFSEWYDLNELNRITEILEDVEREVAWLLINNYGQQEGLEILESGDYGVIHEQEMLPFSEQGNLAYTMYENYMLSLDIPDNLVYYFNWAKYERDLLLEAYITVGERVAVEVYHY